MQPVVLLSGGVDSAVLAYWIQDEMRRSKQRWAVHYLMFNYGQRHHVELWFAERIARSLNGLGYLIDLRTLRQVLAGSALTSTAIKVPKGHYADPIMKSTVVPNRNMILLSVAAGFAVSRQCDTIAMAMHQGDHAVYPDCRPEFVGMMNDAIRLATIGFGQPELITPFLNKTKADIVRLGHRLGVPWEETWSCYEGGSGWDGTGPRPMHCGTCGTCVERKEAFEIAKVADPTHYIQ